MHMTNEKAIAAPDPRTIRNLRPALKKSGNGDRGPLAPQRIRQLRKFLPRDGVASTPRCDKYARDSD